MRKRTLTASGAMVLAALLGAAAPAFAASGSPAAPGGSRTAPPAPSLTITPKTLDFGSQEIGTTSAPRTLTVTNTGSTPAHVGWLDIQDPPGTGFQGSEGEFTSNPNASCTNAVLAPGASCTVSLTFAPFALGPQPVVVDVMADNTGTDLYQVAATASVTGEGFTDGVYVGSVTVPGSVTGGQSVTGTIRTASTPGGSDCKTSTVPEEIILSATAWASVHGTIVNVASLPSNHVIVPAGQCKATFTLTTSPVTTDVPGSVQARAADDPNDPPTRRSAGFTVTP
jgi:hypothetical protein